MWMVGLGEEFRVELRADVEGMIGKFDDFDEAFICGDGRNDETTFLEFILVIGIDLVAVAVAFTDAINVVVKISGFGAGEEDRF